MIDLTKLDRSLKSSFPVLEIAINTIQFGKSCSLAYFLYLETSYLIFRMSVLKHFVIMRLKLIFPPPGHLPVLFVQP